MIKSLKFFTIIFLMISQFILISPIGASSTIEVTFTEILVTSEFNGVIGITTADIDGDQDIDIVAIAQGSQKVCWFENLGNLTFTEHMVATSNFRGARCSVANLDGDEDNDIIVSSLAEGQIKVWLTESEEENSSSTISFAWNSIWIVFLLLYRKKGR